MRNSHFSSLGSLNIFSRENRSTSTWFQHVILVLSELKFLYILLFLIESTNIKSYYISKYAYPHWMRFILILSLDCFLGFIYFWFLTESLLFFSVIPKFFYPTLLYVFVHAPDKIDYPWKWDRIFFNTNINISLSQNYTLIFSHFEILCTLFEIFAFEKNFSTLFENFVFEKTKQNENKTIVLLAFKSKI